MPQAAVDAQFTRYFDCNRGHAMKMGIFLAAWLLLGWHGLALAAIRPSFSLEYSVWNATDIVVGTAENQFADGEFADGEFAGGVQVLEVWKGDLRPGEEVKVPELRDFASSAGRIVTSGLSAPAQSPPLRVTGSRIVLFLQKPARGSRRWQAADAFHEMKASVVWIEQGQTYSFVQVINPGPSVLTPLRVSEAEMNSQVREIAQTQHALSQAAALKNSAQKAQVLRPFVASKHFFARDLAFAELGKTGKSALPILRAMLGDSGMLPQHDAVVAALGMAGGPEVGAELTRLVEAETDFWKQTAPQLKSGWWNGTGLSWTEVEMLRNRYMKVFSALNTLQRLHSVKNQNAKIQNAKTQNAAVQIAVARRVVTQRVATRRAVARLRDLWKSLPQLEDKSGLDQMSAACDSLLSTLH